jgi:hypothetical protein
MDVLVMGPYTIERLPAKTLSSRAAGLPIKVDA